MQLVDEQDDLSIRIFNLFKHGLQPVFKLAAILRSRHHRSQIEPNDPLVLQRLRHIARDNPLRQPFDNRRFADTWLADQYRIIFRSPRQHLHHPPDFLIPPNHRIKLPAPRQFRQIFGITFQRLMLRFRILIRHFLRSANSLEGLEDGVMRRAVAGQQFLGGITLQRPHRQQQMFG